MHWKRREYKQKGVYYKYSLSKKLRSENRSSEEFEFMLNKLTFEELIALKLEVCSKSINGKLSGMKLWRVLPHMVKKALLLYSMSITNTRYEAASAIGLPFSTYLKVLEKYDDEELQLLKKQFQEENN